MTTALITGANRGIGRAVATQLARQGATVVVTGRDLAAAETTAEEIGERATAVLLDVTDTASVRAAAEQVLEQHGGLDVLVNNAAILPEASRAEPTEVVDLAMFEQTHRTNVLGAVAVLEAFLPLLRRSPAGRIVNVSTRMGSLSDQTDPSSPYHAMVVPAYQSSKAALNTITIALAKQLTGTPIKVTSVCPGFVRTDLTPLNRDQAPLTPAEAARVVVRAATLPPDARSGTFVDADGAVAW